MSGAASRRAGGAYLVQPVGESVVGAGGSADNSPVVDDELVATWRGLSLGDFLERANNLH